MGLAKFATAVLLWSTPHDGVELRPELVAEVDRLEGHDVTFQNGGYQIVDVAGEGAPLVGCIEKTERGLELVSGSERFLLRGPLAVPRIAGPNYKVWILGRVLGSAELQMKRLGILAGPSACSK